MAFIQVARFKLRSGVSDETFLAGDTLVSA